jgi:hypothetical protein
LLWRQVLRDQRGEVEVERVHGLAQVVAGRRQEARLGLAGRFRPPAFFHQLFDECHQLLLRPPQRVHRLVERLVLELQVLGARRHPVLQRGIGVLQLRRHGVELRGELLDLVARMHLRALVEASGADGPRTGLQGLDRAHHAPGHHHRGDHRQHHAQQQEQHAAHDEDIERAEGLGLLELDEHAPAQLRNRRERGQHLPAIEVVAGQHAVAVERAGQRRLDLRQRGQALLLQHLADVRMRQQRALAIHHVGIAGGADLDARHGVRDELEVDLGQQHAIAVVAGGPRHAHVGLAVAAKVEVAVEGGAGRRQLERRTAGVVTAGVDLVHVQA